MIPASSQKRLHSSSEQDSESTKAKRHPLRRRITTGRGLEYQGSTRQAETGRRDDISSSMQNIAISPPQHGRTGPGGGDINVDYIRSRSRSKIRDHPDVYTPRPDDGPEVADEMDDSRDRTRPMFTLDKFVIFDPANGNEIVSLRELNVANAVGMRGEPREFEAVGLVKPIEERPEDEDGDVDDADDVDDAVKVGSDDEGARESDEDEDEDEARAVRESRNRVRLGSIWKYEVAVGSADPSIWILTAVGWYKLLFPAPQYRPYYQNLWLRHRLVHLVITSAKASEERLHTSEDAYADFLSSLRVNSTCSDEVAEAIPVLGRELCEADVNKLQPYIIQQVNKRFQALSTSSLIYAIEHLLINDVPSDSESDGYAPSDSESVPDSPSVSPEPEPEDAAPPRRRSRKPATNIPRPKIIESQLLKSASPTFVTPYIGRISRQLFQKTLFAAGQEGEDGEELDMDAIFEDNTVVADDVIDDNFRVVSDWVGPEVRRQKADPHRKFYTGIRVNGTEYKVGDVVLVRLGDDEDIARAKNTRSHPSHSLNNLANVRWFAIITELFETDVRDRFGDSCWFHAQWLLPGSQTILQEAASPDELFLTTDCDDCALTCLVGSCSLRWLQPQDPEPRSVGGNNFFCRFLYSARDASFTNAYPPAPDYGSDCGGCAFKADAIASITPSPADPDNTRAGFYFNNTIYHIGDCVYAIPDFLEIYTIAQIVKFDKSFVWVRLLRRDESPFHPRRLYSTNNKEKWHIERLEGKCWVKSSVYIRDLDEWNSRPDHYYLDGYPKFPQCSVCLENDRMNWLSQEEYTSNSKLRVLDLYSGAGGLSHGLEASGFTKSVWAVDISPSACATYK
ncbi:hypothetical protein BOTBODRAFT_259969 [Botryobasidium botryosum FD-172 SS1]|uniref:DNA (cytosine-5-)-methyltransferase n=1 Tax=Botryobasidium botryosum (strain FD-172 SS1) TaxID=930990 RepID=A0A067MXU6_BOTB1|nr:hypothetical protein BOTBODRAFT_259969 [Botryobasidium botryosum FD-172 SS1]